jgi:succinate dehydrogenase / fumarate reductase flavoprotein subunit
MNMNFYQGKLSGVTVLRRRDSNVMPLACKSLVLAAGGYAGIYRGHTTNSQESSGDAIAAALRAGMRLSNMEFVQFHPTTLKHKAVLISEAGRGEGAKIVDEEGTEFVDPLLTRDKLSRAILKHEASGHEAFLDFRHLDEKLIDEKLPSTKKTALLSAGIDISKELLPIEPAAHYSIGGIWSRADTSTDISGVFVCGESALTGVHGANRLGGNSLLEGAFFGRRAGLEAAREAKRNSFKPIDYSYIEKETRIVDMIMEGENVYNSASMRKSLGEVMFKHVGVFRDEKGLMSALDYIHYLLRKSHGLHCVNKEKENNVELLSILEFNNALLVAESIVMSALKRKESRGVHYRMDYKAKDDKHFHASSFISMISNGLFKVRFGSPDKKSFFYKLKKLLK